MIKLLVLLISFLCLSISNAHEIEISGRNYRPYSVAINKFLCSEQNSLSSYISEVVRDDLESSGLFTHVPESAFVEGPQASNHIPFFPAWRKINTTILINVELNKLQSDLWQMKFKVWDVVLGKSLAEKEIEFYQDSCRRAAHKVSDCVYKAVTGEEGHFDTKIVYIAEYQPAFSSNVSKRLAIMDQDGKNHRYLTSEKNLTISPKISPKNDKILYVDFRQGVSKVFIRHLYTGQDSLLVDVQGSIFAPRFSNDGSKALFSVANKGVTHVFEVNIEDKKMRKLTSGISINTSPSYSPDDKYIAFNSDRSGSPQIYIMSSDGTNIRRISSGSEGAYLEPSWSPRGDYISCTKIVRGKGFSLGIINLKDESERTLATAKLIHGHSWAPNGQFIVYSEEENKAGSPVLRLYKVHLHGHFKTLLSTPHNASDPHWSTVQRFEAYE